MDQRDLEKVFVKHGFHDFRWISGRDIVIGQWVRFKCMFMCHNYGHSAVCPPNMPPIEECRAFFTEYSRVVVLHREIQTATYAPDEVLLSETDESLLNLEKEVFLAGFYKAIALPMTVCYQCRECTGNITTCRHKDRSRPNPEALGVDVFTTVRRIGYPIEVLTSYRQAMNRYALLLVD